MPNGRSKVALTIAMALAAGAGSAGQAQIVRRTPPPVTTQARPPVVTQVPSVTARKVPRVTASQLPHAPVQNQASKLVVKPDESDWYTQGGSTADAPEIVSLGADRMGLGFLVRDEEGNLAWRVKGATINPWKTIDLGGVVASGPSCVSRWEGGDVLDCFYRRTDDSMAYLELRNWTVTKSQVLPRGVQGIGLKLGPSVSRHGNDLLIWSLDGSDYLVALEAWKEPLAGGGYKWGDRFRSFDSHITYEYFDQFYTTQPSCTDSADPDRRDLYCYAVSKKNNRFEEIQEFREGGANITQFWAEIPPYPPGLASTKPYALNGAMVIKTIFVVARPTGVTLTVDMNKPAPETRTSELGGSAASGANCVVRGAAMANAQFACAVRRANGSVWVREFQLAE